MHRRHEGGKLRLPLTGYRPTYRVYYTTMQKCLLARAFCEAVNVTAVREHGEATAAKACVSKTFCDYYTIKIIFVNSIKTKCDLMIQFRHF